MLEAKAPNGSYSICPGTPPKMSLVDPSCKRVTVKLGVLDCAGALVSTSL